MRIIDWRDSLAMFPMRWRHAVNVWKRRRAFLGLDVGVESVRLVEMMESDGQLQVTHVDEAAVNGAGMLAPTLTRLLRDSHLHTTHVATAVPGADVISKRIVIGLAADGDFDGAIHTAAAEAIPEDLANVNLDYQVLGTLDGGRKIEVLLVAARKEIVAARVATLRSAGLKPMVIDVDSFALGNAFEANYDLPLPSTAVLLHIAEQRVAMNVVQGGRSLLAVDVPLSRTGKDVAAGSELAELVDEIHHAISFYWPLDSSTSNLVYVSGNVNLLPALQQHLGERLGAPVAIHDPFARLPLSKVIDAPELRARAPQFALAVGLALRGFGES